MKLYHDASCHRLVNTLPGLTRKKMDNALPVWKPRFHQLVMLNFKIKLKALYPWNSGTGPFFLRLLHPHAQVIQPLVHLLKLLEEALV